MPKISLRLAASISLLIAASGAIAQGMEACMREGMGEQITELDLTGNKRAGVRTQCQGYKVMQPKEFEAKYGRDEPAPRPTPNPMRPEVAKPAPVPKPAAAPETRPEKHGGGAPDRPTVNRAPNRSLHCSGGGGGKHGTRLCGDAGGT